MNISKLFYGMMFGFFGLSLNLLAAEEVIVYYQKEDKSYEDISKLKLNAGWFYGFTDSKKTLKNLFIKNSSNNFEGKYSIDEASIFKKDDKHISILFLNDKYPDLIFKKVENGKAIFNTKAWLRYVKYSVIEEKDAVIPVKCGDKSLFYNLATKKFMESKDGKLEDILDKKEEKSKEERGTLYTCGKWSGILALISAGGFGIYRLWDWFNGKQLTGAPQRPTEEFRLRQAIQGQADASDTASRPVVAQRQAQVAPQAARRRP